MRSPQVMIRLGQLTGLLLLCGWGLGCSHENSYRFVNTISGRTPPPPRRWTRRTPCSKPWTRQASNPPRIAWRHQRWRDAGRGTPGNTLARAYIVSRLRHAGLTPLFRGEFEQPTFVEGGGDHPYAVNVGAYLPAAEPTTDWIVLVAHYDHLGMHGREVYPGADDNAAAVVMLLTLGDALGRARPPLRRHVVLLFPDAEEPPNTRTHRMGSTWFWRHPPFPLAALHCALVFDLLVGPRNPVIRSAGPSRRGLRAGRGGQPRARETGPRRPA